MVPSQHVAAAAAVVVPLARRGWRPRALAAFAAAAVLIDVDHYLSYVWKTGDLSPIRAYFHHRSRVGPVHRPVRPRWPALGWQEERPFHAFPVLLTLSLLAWRWQFLRPIAWGVLFHRLLDATWESISAPASVASIGEQAPGCDGVARGVRPAALPVAPVVAGGGRAGVASR